MENIKTHILCSIIDDDDNNNDDDNGFFPKILPL